MIYQALNIRLTNTTIIGLGVDGAVPEEVVADAYETIMSFPSGIFDVIQ